MKRAFYAGLLASGAAGAIMLAFRLGTAGITVPEVLVDVVTRMIPLRLFSDAVDILGPWAKRLLVVAATIALFLAGGLVAIGWRRLREHWPALRDNLQWPSTVLLGLVLWLLAVVIVLSASGRGLFDLGLNMSPVAAVPAWLVSSLAYSLTLTALIRKSELAPGKAPATAPEVSAGRRTFLKAAGWTAVGVVAAAAVGAAIWRAVSRLPAGLLPWPAESGMTSEVTPIETFFTVSKGFVDPRVDATTWKLEVKGLVEQPLSFNYQQIRDLPAVSQYLTLECISNSVGGDLMGTALWKGVRLQELLSRAGVRPTARKVVLRAFDGYSDSITVAKAMEQGTLLAYEMNGVPLPGKHGFPARLLVPDIYGMKNVKWLTGIEVVDYDYQGYWQERGWSDTARIQTMSRIDVPPLSGDYRVPEKATLSGVAFAGERGTSRVEVSTDDGNTWSRASIKESLSQYTWVLWVYDWRPPGEGTYTLAVRAADGTGEAQTDVETDSLPDGATGYHRVVVKLKAE
ncbi:MAG: molybdopterin-dependent oxidoreductase [Chloroflexi bacterium]|nr:molybdopterin-dependent oxidoreductase [Chloroflexota bacterium]